MDRIVIVGASLAGTQAAQALRRAGFEESIVVIGDEPHLPYDRPPLSKAYLAGEIEEDRLRLRPVVDPDELGVDWHLGRRAIELRLDGEGGGGHVACDGDGPIPFDGLVITAGARPRTIPAAEGLGGVYLLRTLDEATTLRAVFDTTSSRVLVIGCGFIGAEVAATARERGLDVTIVEAAPTPLSRVLDPESGMAIAELHRSHGVDVRLETSVAEFSADDQGNLIGVELSDGTSLETAVAVIGIGVQPNTEWLDGSGLTIDDGIVADETCLAAPGVVVAGDIARWPNRRFSATPMRIEQWDNAVDMGTYAAKRLLAWSEGADIEPFAPVPWFWSDQYDRKIQLAGIAGPHSQVVQGAMDEPRFAQVYVDENERLLGALCWNRPPRHHCSPARSRRRFAGRSGRQAGLRSSLASDPAAELVEVVDENGDVVDVVTRQEVRAHNLRHRCTYVAVATTSDDLVVHQRAAWKDVYPSYWDISFGGISEVGEPWDDAAQRELAEEAGIVGVDLIELGPVFYDDIDGRIVGRAYLARYDGDLSCPDGEVVAVDRVPIRAIDRWLEGRDVCPDSLQLVLPLVRTHLSAD